MTKRKITPQPPDSNQEEMAPGGIVADPSGSTDIGSGDYIVPIEVVPSEERPEINVHIHIDGDKVAEAVAANQSRYEEHLKRIQGGK